MAMLNNQRLTEISHPWGLTHDRVTNDDQWDDPSNLNMYLWRAWTPNSQAFYEEFIYIYIGIKQATTIYNQQYDIWV